LPLREAAIRITKFKVPCGSKCVHPNCIYSGASCRGHDPKVWYAGMQEEIFVGKLDTTAAAAACGTIFHSESVPLESDY